MKHPIVASSSQIVFGDWQTGSLEYCYLVMVSTNTITDHLTISFGERSNLSASPNTVLRRDSRSSGAEAPNAAGVPG